MTITVAQQASNDTSAAGSTLATTLTVTAGNSLYIVAYINDTFTISSVANSGADTQTATLIGSLSDPTSGEHAYHYYVTNLASSGSVTVTLTASLSTADFKSIAVWEVSGCTTAAPTAIATPNLQRPAPAGTDAVTSGSITPTSQPCLLIGVCINVSSTNVATIGTGFTSAGAAFWPTFGSACKAEYQRLTSTAATAATFTRGAADDYITHAAIFYEAGGGGGGGTTPSTYRSRALAFSHNF